MSTDPLKFDRSRNAFKRVSTDEGEKTGGRPFGRLVVGACGTVGRVEARVEGQSQRPHSIICIRICNSWLHIVYKTASHSMPTAQIVMGVCSLPPTIDVRLAVWFRAEADCKRRLLNRRLGDLTIHRFLDGRHTAVGNDHMIDV